MEEANVCVQIPFLVALISIITGSLLLYGIIHSLEKKQSKVEDALLAKEIARKLYESLKKEKTHDMHQS